MFSHLLIDFAGYENAMLLKHIFIFITGFSGGALCMYFVSMKIMINYTKREDIPGIAVLKIIKNGKSYYCANPQNIFEASYVFFSCLFLNDRKPHIRKEDAANKIKAFAIIFITLLIVLHFFGIFASLGIVERP